MADKIIGMNASGSAWIMEVEPKFTEADLENIEKVELDESGEVFANLMGWPF